MQYSSELFTYLPRLRRYARVICGGRAAGDDLVAAVIQRLELSPVNLSSDPLVGLFEILVTLWAESAGTDAEWNRKGALETGGGGGAVAALSVSNRQAYLLVELEGFSHEQVARMLKTDVAEINALYSEAGEIISKQPAVDVLIVEDDVFVAEDLKLIVADLGHHVVGIARTASEAVALSQSVVPELILCDISLADGSSGIVAVNEIFGGEAAPVVFITSSPERLLTGRNEEPAFIIRKPYSPEQVRAITGQVLLCRVENQSYRDAELES